MDDASLARFNAVVERMPRIAAAVDAFTDSALQQQVYYSLLNMLDPEPVDPEPDDRTVPAERERDDLVEALRLTVEYVGTDVLKPQPGWTWFDVLSKYAPEVAAQFAGTASSAEADQQRPIIRHPTLQEM